MQPRTQPIKNAYLMEIQIDSQRRKFNLQELAAMLKGRKLSDLTVMYANSETKTNGDVLSNIITPLGRQCTSYIVINSAYITFVSKGSETVKQMPLSLFLSNVYAIPTFDNLEIDWNKSYIDLAGLVKSDFSTIADNAVAPAESILLLISFN